MQVRTVTTYTCDLCGQGCDKDDGAIDIQVDSGDGRDVGPGFVRATLTAWLPYRVNDGLVCATCKMKWLREYVRKGGMA